MSQIAIIGAGAWEAGVSIVLVRKGAHRLRLWAFEKEVRDSISSRRVNELFLPGHSIPDCVLATGSLDEALHGAEIVVSVMPSQHCRRLFEQMRTHLQPKIMFVSATKGLEEKTLLRMTEVISQVIASGGEFQPPICALSRPSLSTEVAPGDPTAITNASQEAGLVVNLTRRVSEPPIR